MKGLNAGKNIVLLIVYRALVSIITKNYEYPDQHWQGPEVAHNIQYGYGYLSWQWTFFEPIRNPVYPYLLSLSYKIVQILSFTSLLPHAHRLISQLIFCVIADYYLIKIITFLYGQINKNMLIVCFCNWYYASTLIRTYTNSLETCLFIVSFYYWITNSMDGSNNKKDLINRIIVTISYVIRPTSIMMWVLLWPYQLYQVMKIRGVFSKKSIYFVLKNILNLAIMILTSLIIGSIYYGKLTLTQLNFIKVLMALFSYNIIQKWSNLFGQQHFLYFFFISIPFMVSLGLIFLFLSMIIICLQSPNKDKDKQEQQINILPLTKRKQLKVIICMCLAYILVSSLSTHKEHRFIFPVVPFILIISLCVFKFESFHIFGFKFGPLFLRFILILYILLNFTLLGVFSFHGKSDSKSAWNHIRTKMDDAHMNQNETSVIVLGEAHFMEGYSILHRNITYRIPDASAIKMATNSSQNKLLWQNPQKLYKILTDNKSIKPTFIIAQGKHLKHTSHILINQKYKQTAHWRHCTIAQQIFLEYDSINLFQPTS